MSAAYWIIALAGAAFLGFAHCHTDEIPIVLGFVVIVGAILGALAPRKFVISWAIAGAPVPVVEMLVHYSLLSAPWPKSDNPWVGMVAYVPAAMGVAVGAGLRKLSRAATAG